MGCLHKVFSVEIDVELFQRGRAHPARLRRRQARRAAAAPLRVLGRAGVPARGRRSVRERPLLRPSGHRPRRRAGLRSARSPVSVKDPLHAGAQRQESGIRCRRPGGGRRAHAPGLLSSAATRRWNPTAEATTTPVRTTSSSTESCASRSTSTTSPSVSSRPRASSASWPASSTATELEDLVNLTVNGEVQDPASALGEHVNDCWPELVGPADRSLVHWLRRLVFRSAWLDQRVKEGELDVVFDDATHTFGYVQPERDREPIELSPEPNWGRVRTPAPLRRALGRRDLAVGEAAPHRGGHSARIGILVDLDAHDPLDPLEAAPARRHEPARRAVAVGERLAAHAGREQQAARVVEREAPAIAGARDHAHVARPLPHTGGVEHAAERAAAASAAWSRSRRCSRAWPRARRRRRGPPAGARAACARGPRPPAGRRRRRARAGGRRPTRWPGTRRPRRRSR